MTPGEVQALERRAAAREGPEALAEQVIKEMTTKLAWAVGSTVHVAYGRKSSLRGACREIAEDFYRDRMDLMDYNTLGRR